MTKFDALPVTITIPVFATPPVLLDGCFRSIAGAVGRGDEVFVVVDGPQSSDLEKVLSSAGAFGFAVVRQTMRIGLVANWNACLRLGSRELVHVMHADDAVAPAFYGEVRAAMEQANVSMVASGWFPSRLETNPILGNRDAARYLLSRDKPPTGSFVLRRSVLGPSTDGFDARYPYCPDEELFLRVLASGDLSVVDQRLYSSSRHDQQARYSTWHRLDFADVYYGARMEGARALGGEVMPLARRETTRRLLGVGRFLCRAGDGRAARSILRSITSHDKQALLTWRFWALLLLAIAARGSGPSPEAKGVWPADSSRLNP